MWKNIIFEEDDDAELTYMYLYWDGTWASGRRSALSIPKIIGSNPSGGSEVTFRSDLLMTARGSSMRALIEFVCLLCYPGKTLLSAPRATQKGWVGVIQIPKYIYLFF
jgi:hypothetical protein